MSPLLINEPPLQVLPTLAVKIGLNEAMILQQVHYWLNPKLNANLFEGRYWVRNTYEQWQQQFPFLGERTIRRAISNLEEKKLLLSFVTRDFQKVKFYTINYEQLEQINMQTLPTKKLSISSQLPSGQNDQIDLATGASERLPPSGQIGQIDQANVATFSIPENTLTDIITPPLTPPQQKNEEEEEEKCCKHKCEQMLEVWNAIVHEKLHPGKKVFLFQKRSRLLQAFLEKTLQGDMEAWESYCKAIASLGFLMGDFESGFKVSLEWALRPENAHKIWEGGIYDKPSKEVSVKDSSAKNGVIQEQPWGEFFPELRAKIQNTSLGATWYEVSRHLAYEIGQVAYTTWFEDVTLVDVSDTSLTLHVLNSFTRSYILTHYVASLERSTKQVFSRPKHILYLIKPSTEGDIA